MPALGRGQRRCRGKEPAEQDLGGPSIPCTTLCPYFSHPALLVSTSGCSPAAGTACPAPCLLCPAPSFTRSREELSGRWFHLPSAPGDALGGPRCPRHPLRPPQRFGPLNGPTAAPAPPGTWGHLAVSPRPQRSPYPPPHGLCQEPSQGYPHPVSDHFSFLQAGWCPCTPKTCDPTPRHLL